MFNIIHPGMILIAACMVVGLGITGCQDESASDPGGAPSGVKVEALEEYDTIVSYEEGTLANPTMIRYDGEKKQVLALNENGETAREFGGEGRGPGEVLSFNNIYLNGNYLYIVDPVQFRIIKYSLDGEVQGSLDYGQKGSRLMPPAAPQPPTPGLRILRINPL